jgi:cell wall-associated NlpC family hydrolase
LSYDFNLRPISVKCLVLLCALFSFALDSAGAKKPTRKKAVARKVVRKAAVRKKVPVRAKRRVAAVAAPKGPLQFAAEPVNSELKACSTQSSGLCWNCVEQAISTARAFTGLPYRRGGSDPKVGFDCSGFVKHVFANSCSLQLPRSAREQYTRGQEVAREELQKGDLVFFSSRRGWHVGIYTGDDKFIHSPNRKDSIRESTLETPYWKRSYRGARRLATEIAPPVVSEGLAGNIEAQQ